jgi:hypothetical protein
MPAFWQSAISALEDRAARRWRRRSRAAELLEAAAGAGDADRHLDLLLLRLLEVLGDRLGHREDRAGTVHLDDLGERGEGSQRRRYEE